MKKRAPSEEILFPSWAYHVIVLSSALFFAVSSALAKVVVRSGVPAEQITFFRFAIGLVILLVYLGAARPKLAPRHWPVLILRGVFNMGAVFLFYSACRYTTITNANLLNLTYPIFVALLGPLLLGEKLRGRDWILLILAVIGIWLVVNPTLGRVNVGDLFGLACGLVAGFSMITLRAARRGNQTHTVLLFMLATGTIILSPVVFEANFGQYDLSTWGLLLACGAAGVMGQFAVTLAFGHISAFEGSLTGTTRVIIAASIGIIFLGESISWNVLLGALFLFVAICLLAKRAANGGSLLKGS